MYKFQFSIQALPPTTNSHGRVHWAIKAKLARQWKDIVCKMVYNHKPKKPLKKAKLVLTRHSSRACDADGIVSSFKHIIDGLVLGGVIEDDTMEIIGMPDYRYEKAPAKKGFVTILIEEINLDK